jgi:uncharacterized 2Fe-2S/4Fe-4S cluster protein (DUF4445 family)
MEFQNQFVAAINFPHTSDPFPHLDGTLPDMAQQPATDGRRRRRRTLRSETQVNSA